MIHTGRDESACACLEGALLEELFEDGGLSGANASSDDDASVPLQVLTTQLLQKNKGSVTLRESERESECDDFL